MRKRVAHVIAILAWIIVLSVITIRIRYEKGIYGIGAAISDTRLLAVIMMSFAVGIILLDLSLAFYAYILTTSVSIIISVIFTTLNDWYTGGWSRLFPNYSWGLELTAYVNFIKIFRALFPLAIVLSFLAVFLGCIVGNMISARVLERRQ